MKLQRIRRESSATGGVVSLARSSTLMMEVGVYDDSTEEKGFNSIRRTLLSRVKSHDMSEWCPMEGVKVVVVDKRR